MSHHVADTISETHHSIMHDHIDFSNHGMHHARYTSDYDTGTSPTSMVRFEPGVGSSTTG